MVLPCITRQIRSVQLSDELTDSKSKREECRNRLVIESALEYVIDFLRPLTEEVNIQPSYSEEVRYLVIKKLELKIDQRWRCL